MNMMKKMKFDTKDNWNLHTFYQIFLQDDVKMIRIIGALDRQSREKNYLSWICIYCKKDCVMPLEDFLLWDVYFFE